MQPGTLALVHREAFQGEVETGPHHPAVVLAVDVLQLGVLQASPVEPGELARVAGVLAAVAEKLSPVRPRLLQSAARSFLLVLRLFLPERRPQIAAGAVGQA